MKPLAASVAVVLAILIASIGRARAADDEEEPPPRMLRFFEDGANVTVSGTFADAFDARLAEKLDSGFATTVVLRAYVYRRDDGRKVAFAAATFRVVFDLWDETYLVERIDSRGVTRFRRRTRAEALRDVTTLERFPVAPLSAIPVGPHFALAAVVEVNPISPDLLAEVRRWLARRPGGDDPTGNSFFGAFVSIFVNPKLEQAERTLRFRSQWFYRVKR